MKLTKLSKYYVFISVASFIAVMFVIIQQSYTKLMGPINIAKSSNLTKQISPNLDTTIIDKIEAKKEYLNTDIVVGSIVSEITTPTPTTSP